MRDEAEISLSGAIEAAPLPKKGKIPKAFYKVILWGVIIFLFYHYIDFKQFLSIVSGASWPFIILMLIASSVDRFLMAYKWRHLAAALNLFISFKESVKAYYAASFLNNTLPSTLGGDVFRGEYMARVVKDRKSAYAVLVMEKIIGILSTLFIGSFGLVYVANFNHERWVGLASHVLAWVSLALGLAFVFSFNESIHEFFARVLMKIRLKKMANIADKFFSAYRRFSSHRKVLFQNFWIANIENIIQMGIPLLAGFSLGLTISPLIFYATIAITTMIRRLSIIFDSWGLTEAIIVTIYSTAGLEPSRALAITLLTHVVMAVSILPGGPILSRSGVWIKES